MAARKSLPTVDAAAGSTPDALLVTVRLLQPNQRS
jgi:hypothetical protein